MCKALNVICKNNNFIEVCYCLTFLRSNCSVRHICKSGCWQMPTSATSSNLSTVMAMAEVVIQIPLLLFHISNKYMKCFVFYR